MIGLSPEEWNDIKKGPASKAPAPKQGNSVIDQALAAEGVQGRAADFVRSIYQQESSSGGNTKTSNRGAVGGMQIIPSTFKLVANPDWDINNPVDNARAGIRYAMRQWNASRGNPAVAAAGYYGGDGGRVKAAQGVAVNDPKNPNAPNTLEYGQQVAARMGSSAPAAMPAPSTGPGTLASGARGLVQGATAGFSDELAGAGGAVGNAMNKTGVKPTAMMMTPFIGTTISALMVLAGSKSKDESIADTYARIRDSERKANAEAKGANPGTYNASQILGTLLPAYLIKNPAALGAVNAAGNSEADTIGGLAKDTAVGAAIGGVTGGASKLVGTGVQKIGDKLGNEAIDRVISAAGPATGIVKSTLGGATAGAGAGAAGGAGWAISSGQVDKIPEYAWNGAVGGAAVGATGALKSGAGNKIASEIYKRTGDANMGTGLVNSAATTAAKTVGNAAQANIGSSEPAREAGGDVMDWIKNVVGMDTPAGEQNLPHSFRNKMEADAAAVREGLKDGRPSPDVPNIIREGGNEYLVTPSGRRVQLN
jgi:hypothetical protein